MEQLNTTASTQAWRGDAAAAYAAGADERLGEATGAEIEAADGGAVTVGDALAADAELTEADFPQAHDEAVSWLLAVRKLGLEAASALFPEGAS